MKLLVLVLLWVLIAASAASAGEFHVYSCRTPAGEPAPVDGWSGSKSGTYTYATDTCGEGGSLMAALGDQTLRVANADIVTWSLNVPSAMALTHAVLWRAGDVYGGSLGASYQFWIASPNEPSVIDECVSGLGCVAKGTVSEGLAAVNRVEVPAAKLGGHILVRAGCGGAPEYECPAGKGDANNYAAVVYLYAADLVLEQTAGPAATNVGAELATAPTVAGASDLTFTATDPGAGVYEAVFTVDGQVVQRTVIDSNGGRCRDVGESSDGLPAFLYLQPCPQSVSADVGFDTTRIGNGVHHLVVTVIDAAGNSAPVLDRTLTVANPGVPGPPNGQGASAEATLAARWRRTPRELTTAAYGVAQTIDGRLLGLGGAPIAGAVVEASATPSYAGALSAPLRPVTTGPDGRFSLVVAAASSRSVLLAYRARLGDPSPAARRTLGLAVHAPLSLRITPRTAHAGSTIRFAGRLAGGPIPAGGKAVVLEARSGGGRWLEFNVIHSDRAGRFHARYTFRFPGPASYQFRALSEAEADYPFARGSSSIVPVYEY